jgi:hypothetical protein
MIEEIGNMEKRIKKETWSLKVSPSLTKIHTITA